MLAPKLQPGDTVGLFSPSSPASAFAPERYRRGVEFLKSRGYRVREGALAGKRDGYRSGSVQERADELNALLRDPEVRCVMSVIGGMNSNSLLPYLDCGALRRDPKILVGYSDVTALLLGVFAQTGLVTYYGPAAAASLGEWEPLAGETFSYFESVVSGAARPPYTLPTPARWTDEFLDWNSQQRAKTTRPNALVTAVPGRAEGRLIGGNLNTLLGIWGTPWMPEIREGDILFLEDSLLDAADQERSFAHLKLAGVFDRIGGLVLGKHEGYRDLGCGRQPWEILPELLDGASFPVLAQFDCCHTHPMLTLPLGCRAVLDADAKTLTILEPFIG